MGALAIPDDVQCVLADLRGDGDLRVWSVIVTIMGDLARGKDESVSGAMLGTLMGALGIRPEAIRVALHRLRKDGWITSERAGRGSLYSLTDDGRAQTHAVANTIYGNGPAAPDTWHLAILLPSSDHDKYVPLLSAEGFIQIAPDTFLGTTSPGHLAGVIHFSDHDPALPDDILAWLLPDETRADAQRLRASLAQLDTVDVQNLDPLSKAALRILILHNWRRIALRLPKLPLHPTWPEARLRRDVHHHLKDIGQISLRDVPI